MTLEERVNVAANKLAKWRNVFAGWQLGTRLKTDPESQAVRDHREVTILLRAEVSALTRLLIEECGISLERLNVAMADEFEQLDRDYERRFPGITTDHNGVHYSLPEATETMKGWLP